MTLEQIEQRLSALKEEQDKLTAELAKLKSEQAEVKPWRAEHNMPYWIIDTCNGVNVHSDWEDPNDDKRYSCGNYYRTNELAERDAKELALRGRVRQLRDALCEGNRFVENELNYSIRYNHKTRMYQPSYSANVQIIAGVYFDTEEHAQQACYILNAELIKEE